MALISSGDDGGDGEDSGGVSGGEAAAFEGRFASVEKCVVKFSAHGNVRRAFSSRDGLHGEVDDCAIGISFCGEDGCADFMLVMPPITRYQECHRDSSDFRGGDGAVKGVIQIVEVARVVLEIRHHMRISDDKASGCAGNGKSGNPVAALNELHGKQPNLFLVMKEVFRQRAPGDLFILDRGVGVRVAFDLRWIGSLRLALLRRTVARRNDDGGKE